MESIQRNISQNPVALCLLISVLVVTVLVFLGVCSCDMGMGQVERPTQPIIVTPILTPNGNGNGNDNGNEMAEEDIPQEFAPYLGTDATGYTALGNLGMFAGVFALMVFAGLIYLAYQRGLAAARAGSLRPLFADRQQGETVL